MQKLLSECHINEKGTVIKVNGDTEVRQRLFDIGLTKGAKVVFSKISPLGDPIEIFVRGYYLSLRKKEASRILLEVE
ncbi:MAG: ferrous iron transport protein A [Acholeplasmatales bacterium]|jgi:Fe2+ transport system protein FeoA|nr:ferrous iron transport protein A [Acholeplasmatales bacterium]